MEQDVAIRELVHAGDARLGFIAPHDAAMIVDDDQRTPLPHEVELARQGWEAVPASRHPQMMPKGNWQTIDRDGMVLMERPKVLTDDIHKENLRKARLQVRAKEAQLNQAPEGTFERDDPRVRPSIKKSFEAMPITESE